MQPTMSEKPIRSASSASASASESASLVELDVDRVVFADEREKRSRPCTLSSAQTGIGRLIERAPRRSKPAAAARRA
jgi:hypothetical protein